MTGGKCQPTLVYVNDGGNTSAYPFFAVILRRIILRGPRQRERLLWFDTFQDVYGVPDSKAQLQRLIVDSPQISDDWLKRMKEQEDMVIIVPYSFPDSLCNSLQPLLEQTGKTACDVSDLPGKFLRYQMWYSPRYSNLSLEAQSIY